MPQNIWNARNRGTQPAPVSSIRLLPGICIVALMLAGCAVGPNFKPPEASLPAQWAGADPSGQGPISSVNGSEPVMLEEWWKNFDDETLNRLIGKAIQSNLDIQQATSRIREARALGGVGGAALWPAVDSSASYTHSETGENSASSSKSKGTKTDLFAAGLDASWELDIFGGQRRNVEALEADLLAAVEDRRDVLVTLVSEVGINYANLRGYQEQIAIAKKNLESQNRSADITRRRFEAGYVSAFDNASAKAQAATTAARIPTLEASARQAIYNLGVLLGEEPTALVQELQVVQPIPLTPPYVPVGLPSELLQRRPDIRRAEAQVHAATARVGVATADLFPKFYLTGALGFSGDDLASAARWSSRAWSLGPSVQWPIFDAGKIRWNIEAKNAIEEQALLTYRQAILTALKDVETALMSYAREQERHELLKEAVAQNRKAVEVAMELYTAGQSDFLTVLTAQLSLYSSEDSLTQGTSNIALDLVALYKALGGGWSEAGH